MCAHHRGRSGFTREYGGGGNGERRVEIWPAGPAYLDVTFTHHCVCRSIFTGNAGTSEASARVAVYDASPTTLLGLIVTREVRHGGNAALPILA